MWLFLTDYKLCLHFFLTTTLTLTMSQLKNYSVSNDTTYTVTHTSHPPSHCTITVAYVDQL